MLARMLGAARLNVHTFEEVESDSGATMQAMIVVILVSIAGAIGPHWRTSGIDSRTNIRLDSVGCLGWCDLLYWHNNFQDTGNSCGLGPTGSNHWFCPDAGSPQGTQLPTGCGSLDFPGRFHMAAGDHGYRGSASLGLPINLARCWSSCHRVFNCRDTPWNSEDDHRRRGRNRYRRLAD